MQLQSLITQMFLLKYMQNNRGTKDKKSFHAANRVRMGIFIIITNFCVSVIGFKFLKIRPMNCQFDRKIRFSCICGQNLRKAPAGVYLQKYDSTM